jgi:AbrB family looped-hinge helix DNA binding protein
LIPYFRSEEEGDVAKKPPGRRHVSKVTAKGQVTIPKGIREQLGLEEGEYVIWETRGEEVVMERAAVSSEDEFDALADRIAKQFARKGVSRADVEDAIRWARSRS